MSSRRFDTRRRYIRKKRISNKVKGSQDKPRLAVFRSSRHIYAQVINDEQGHTLTAASSADLTAENHPDSKVSVAFDVGKLIAKRSIEVGVSKIVFDRSGYLYHGRVKALAEAAREGGLVF